MSSKHNTAKKISSLDLFYDQSPSKPYCTNDFSAGLLIRSKKTAFLRRYVQHNPPSMTHWLTFDQDHEDLLKWESVPLPNPNLIVRNQDNRKCHIHYAIESVCISDAARRKPIEYLAAIEAAYCEALGADPHYTGFMTKNPYHDNWHVWEIHDHVYKLAELADYVDLNSTRWTRKRAANENHHGYARNPALFHRLRFWAYDEVSAYRNLNKSYDEWHKAVLSRCEEQNDFQEPLPYSEVKSTAKSVSKWVWTKYWPKGKPAGPMAEMFNQSQIPLDLSTRQRLSARRTASIKREATEKRIIAAIGQLTREGKKVTKAAVARLVGISRQKLSEDYAQFFYD